MALPGEPDDNQLLMDGAETTNPEEDARQLEWRWASFALEVPQLALPPETPPVIVQPEQLTADAYEFVYPIRRSVSESGGMLLETSKGADMFHVGMSMCRLFMTIEKMFSHVIESLEAQNIAPDEEVQVILYGDERAKRKGFEVLINCSRNLISDFDPGAWGSLYLQLVKTHAAMGKGYPPESPRDTFRQVYGATPGGGGVPSR
ncbi:virulence protein [Legionella geestiana]|uniref:Virulence protein n=1 Tax=Legionella geestiana TaxID=45065 RepID=A0A0W0U420_9GAMM|nr:hypothetical protein [Legionella geestiana]KTD02359.1 virulence protein [Legionella geestiana]QBS12166.1 virulence factor [Legionella geestiana]QDQ40120.1 virulence factor [Legionella geestiana]STX53105.1 virulence protein [Legionella geestiana]